MLVEDFENQEFSLSTEMLYQYPIKTTVRETMMPAPMMMVRNSHSLPHTIDKHTQVYTTDMQSMCQTCVHFNCLIFIVYLGHALDDTTGESSGENQRMSDVGGERTNGNHTVTYARNIHVHTHTHTIAHSHHTYTILTCTHYTHMYTLTRYTCICTHSHSHTNTHT